MGGTRFTPEQHESLQAAFRTNSFPQRDDLDELANQTGLTCDQIYRWFTMQRRNARHSMSFVDNNHKSYHRDTPYQRFSDEQRSKLVETLEYYGFYPNSSVVSKLASELGVSYLKVTGWFNYVRYCKANPGVSSYGRVFEENHDLLMSYVKDGRLPDNSTINVLAQKLGVSSRQVRKWFWELDNIVPEEQQAASTLYSLGLLPEHVSGQANTSGLIDAKPSHKPTTTIFKVDELSDEDNQAKACLNNGGIFESMFSDLCFDRKALHLRDANRMNANHVSSKQTTEQEVMVLDSSASSHHTQQDTELKPNRTSDCSNKVEDVINVLLDQFETKIRACIVELRKEVDVVKKEVNELRREIQTQPKIRNPISSLSNFPFG